jgi:hypothetical protein
MAIALRSFSICFAALLGLAVIHKGRVLAAGRAAEEPLLRVSSWRRTHAAPVLLTAGLAESCIAVLLLVSPMAGFGALGALALAYVADLRRLAENEPCNCFGSALRATGRRAAIARNVGIAGVSGVATVLYATSAVTVAPVTQTVIGVALIIAAAVTGVDLLRFVPRVEPDAESRG